MGLYEKTRNVLQRELAELLDPESTPPPEQLHRLLLALDEHRRTLGRSLARHDNELRHLLRVVAAEQAVVARWRNRLELAARRGRGELERAARERLEAAEGRLQAGRRRAETLGAAIANLTAALECIERALRLVRHRRELAPKRLQAAARELLPAAAPLVESGEPAEDELERAFLALELEELGRTLPPPG